MSKFAEGLTVVVCTYNREKYITKCVESLVEALKNVDFNHELIVIDNNSTDNTPVILEKLSAKHNFVSLVESTSGLSFARNCGLRVSNYRIVSFVDDDAFVDSNWAREIYNCFLQSDVGSVGGRISPYYEVVPPEWFSSRYYALYSILDDAGECRPFDKGFGPVGANMAVDISRLDGNIYFNTDLGRVGSSLLSGEEVEYLRRFKKKGYLSLYNPHAKVSHVIPHERLTKEWALKRFYWGGISDCLSQPSRIRKFAVLLITLFNCCKAKQSNDEFLLRCNVRALSGVVNQLLGRVP